jgi:hypothetical protein
MSIPQTDEADLITPTRSTRRPSRRPWWIAAVIVVVVGAAVIIGLVATGHDTGIPFVPKPPTRSAFTFTMGDVSATSLGGHHSKPVARQVAPEVQQTLSDLYGGLFLDPKAWSAAPPDDVWDHFTGAAQHQAKSDGAALGLGDLTGKIETLKVSSSSLQVNVLTDTANKPVAAVAKVTFVADATTKDGQHIQITRNAQYLLDEADGTWLVSGYPLNTTSVDVVQPSAGPSGASGSGSGGSS